MKIELSELSERGSKQVIFKGMEKEEEHKEEPKIPKISEARKSVSSLLETICCCIRKKVIATMFVERRVRLDGTVYPVNSVTNAINNRKYSVLGFVPVVLYNQFKLFFNMFFLLLALSQFIEPLKVGGLRSSRPFVFLRRSAGLRAHPDDAQRSGGRLQAIPPRSRDQQPKLQVASSEPES